MVMSGQPFDNSPKSVWMPQVYDIDEVNAYTRRNEIILLLGFSSYRAYLRSPLWKEIRTKKLKRDPQCFGCGRRAQQVHHGDYTMDNLTGASESELYSVCKMCHRWSEFTKNGHKRNPQEATAELRRVRRLYAGFEKRRVDNRVKMVSKSKRIY